MSWSSRAFGAAFAAGCALLAAGCESTGIHPLYASHGGNLQAELQSIVVEPIPDRLGHYLGDALQTGLNGTGAKVAPKYTLALTAAPAVPVHIINAETAPGIKRGGTVNLVQHAVELLVPADNIPESITVDLDGLDINASVHISAVTLPEGCRPAIRDRDFTVVTIAAPTVMAEEEPATAEAAAAAAPAPAPAGKAGAPAKGGAPAAAAPAKK